MSTKSFEKGMTWAGLAIAAVAALTFGVVQAAGADGGESAPQKKTRIQLAVDRDGTLDRVNLIDLHTMAVGETRNLETESGSPVTVTRDETGFDVDVNGKTIRVEDHFDEIAAGDGNHVFKRRIVVDGEEGDADTMVFHGDGEPGDMVVMKRSADPSAHGFAWATGDAELPPIAFGVDGTIARLEKNAKFLELDEATRAKVIEALRESAPEVRMLRKGPGEGGGARVMVIETDDHDAE